MARNSEDELFCGVCRECYTSIRSEPRKDELTGEAIKILQDFIEEHLNKPYWREVFERNKV